MDDGAGRGDEILQLQDQRGLLETSGDQVRERERERAYHVVRVLQHKPAVDLRAALRTVRIYVGLGQLALHLLGIS